MRLSETCDASVKTALYALLIAHGIHIYWTGLYTGFLPRGGELGVCQKEGGGARLFVAAWQPQGG